jgi:hypothetical protein
MSRVQFSFNFKHLCVYCGIPLSIFLDINGCDVMYNHKQYNIYTFYTFSHYTLCNMRSGMKKNFMFSEYEGTKMVIAREQSRETYGRMTVVPIRKD